MSHRRQPRTADTENHTDQAKGDGTRRATALLRLPGRPREKPERTALILNENGTTEIRSLDEKLNHATSGTYVTEHAALYQLDEAIPAGTVSIYFADDPRPVTRPALQGYNAKFLDIVTGHWVVHAVGGGFEGNKPPMKWGKIIIFGLVVLGLVASGMMWYQERFGGA